MDDCLFLDLVVCSPKATPPPPFLFPSAIKPLTTTLPQGYVPVPDYTAWGTNTAFLGSHDVPPPSPCPPPPTPLPNLPHPPSPLPES